MATVENEGKSAEKAGKCFEDEKNVVPSQSKQKKRLKYEKFWIETLDAATAGAHHRDI